MLITTRWTPGTPPVITSLEVTGSNVSRGAPLTRSTEQTSATLTLRVSGARSDSSGTMNGDTELYGYPYVLSGTISGALSSLGPRILRAPRPSVDSSEMCIITIVMWTPGWLKFIARWVRRPFDVGATGWELSWATGRRSDRMLLLVVLYHSVAFYSRRWHRSWCFGREGVDSK